MIRSFFTITFRVLWRNKVTTFVNIFSLTIGITSFIFIMLYVHHELSYDKFNKNYERIYRLEGKDYGKLPPVIGTYVKGKVPEVENIARLAGGVKKYISYTPENNPENQKQVEAIFFWADSTTFDVFTFPFTRGDPHTALKEPFTVVLTESTAKKLFGDFNPMTKIIEFEGNQFTVTGIIRDVKNSHTEIDALFSHEAMSKIFPDFDLNESGPSAWLWSATYLLMAEKLDKGLVELKINKVLAEINDGNLFDLQFKGFHLRPLKEIYFGGSTQYLQYGLHGNLKLIQIFFAIGIFMLVLACINYINLTTARSTIRAKEIAIKRVAGSSSILLGYQLILESVIVSFVSFVMAMTVLQLFLSKFNQMAMVNIHIAELNNPFVWAGAISGVILLGTIAGIYPAFYLTAIKPIGLMKGEGLQRSGGSLSRKILMTFQFALSIIMLIGILTNRRQMEYVRTADLGFNKEQIITASTPYNFPEEYAQRETFKERLLQHTVIKGVTFSTNHWDGMGTGPFEIEGIERTMAFSCIDQDYFEVMGMNVAEGRNFSIDRLSERFNNQDKASNGRTGILLNETAVREFGIDSPVGKIVKFEYYGKEYESEIIGIIRDFHFRSLHHKVEPFLLFWTTPMHLANIKISSANIPGTLKLIEKEWKNVYGSKPFAYQFLDELYDRHYKSDENLATVIGYFTGLAIVIACLGLFALSSFMVSRRTKEIGVRKSLGASVKTIYFMLSWDFLKWIFLAVVIASPVAFYLINLWLEGFAYHITISADIFVFAALLAIAIALVTVTWQSLRAAYANPVKALRYE